MNMLYKISRRTASKNLLFKSCSYFGEGPFDDKEKALEKQYIM